VSVTRSLFGRMVVEKSRRVSRRQGLAMFRAEVVGFQRSWISFGHRQSSPTSSETVVLGNELWWSHQRCQLNGLRNSARPPQLETRHPPPVHALFRLSRAFRKLKHRARGSYWC
jgi:hypothetical protein